MMNTRQNPQHQYRLDPILIGVIALLLLIGLIMVASASIAIAEKQTGMLFYFFYRQLTAVGLGLILGIVVLLLPLQLWNRYAIFLMAGSLLLLLLVLLPGIGREVNGSTRWLPLGIFNIQVSEIMKLGFIIYLASFIQRKQQLLQQDYRQLLPPLLLLLLTALLLLLEPDLGAVVVIGTCVMGMLFMAGVPLRIFALLVSLAVLAVGLLIWLEPYRLERIQAFLNPWSDPFNTGFQLTQSLMAVGRGEWIGVGLGNSIQKLLYLPEAHTDFIYAIIAEELGLFGAIGIILLFVLLLLRVMLRARQAFLRQKVFHAFIMLGIGLWISFQGFVNIGVNMGILPTKGLTLPFISYGGSSVMIMCIAMALVLRADYESRCHPCWSLLGTISDKRRQRS